MANYLVTGGAGFIGSSIVEALLAKGERVRILDDFSSGRRSNLAALKGEVEVIEGSIVDPEVVAHFRKIASEQISATNLTWRPEMYAPLYIGLVREIAWAIGARVE